MRLDYATALVIGAGLMSGQAMAAELTGLWGAPGNILTVSENGAVLQQDCATGRFGPTKLNKSGAFRLRGSWEDHQPGPQAADAAPPMLSATYSGRLAGDILSLTISRAGHPVQKIDLLKGKRTKIIRCL